MTRYSGTIELHVAQWDPTNGYDQMPGIFFASVCQECGALIDSQDKHTTWHEENR